MTNSITRDQRRRLLVKDYELKRLQYKSIVQDLSLSQETRYYYQTKLNRLPRNSSKSRIRNRCILTGRGQGVFRFCKLSRIAIREHGGKGWIPGLVKASW